MAHPLPPLPGDVKRNAHGKVQVWSVEAEALVWLAPIDAREQIRSGAAMLEKPAEDEAKPAPAPAPAKSTDKAKK